jgi:transcriptional regulator with XRE-family HTH domain
MAPLDTADVMNLRFVETAPERPVPRSSEYETVGAYLRAMRLYLNLSLEDVAGRTRVRATHLQAIEEANLSALPSRPFATGYVRAFAVALGLDAEAAAARFRKETPDFAEPLRNPIGVHHERRGADVRLVALVVLAVAAVVGWNLTQHSQRQGGRRPGQAPLPSALDASKPPPPPGAISLGAAVPPPADQTMPAPYMTPGLDASGAGPPAQSLASGAPETFSTKAAVYGAPAGGRTVVFKALKSVLVIVRGATGAVYFARPLARDEAFRAPVGAGLVAEVADPAAVLVYLDNRLQPPLAASNAPIDKLAAAVPPPPERAPAPSPSGGLAPSSSLTPQAPTRPSAPAPTTTP